jgi:hypothetical protein
MAVREMTPDRIRSAFQIEKRVTDARHQKR